MKLSLGLIASLITRPILTGEIAIEGVDSTAVRLHPSELFWRQLHYAEFDVSDLSIASLMLAAANGDDRWYALPIFPVRRFFHTEILVRETAGIKEPRDLAGKRVGVPEFQQTSAVWVRGALQHEFGVSQESMHWFMERSPSRSHGAATGNVTPENLTIEIIPESSSLEAALHDGAIDAALHYEPGGNVVDRSSRPASNLSGVRRLFSDPVAEGIRYYESTGIAPVNHCIVIRRELQDQYPWLALNVYDAFVRAKRLARDRLNQDVAVLKRFGIVRSGREDFDPLPFGMQAESKTLETLGTYLHEQGLTRETMSFADLLAKNTTLL